MASMCMHGTSIYESTALSKDVITNHPGCLLVIRSTWNQIPGRVCHNLSNGKHEGTRNLPLDSFLCNSHQSRFYIEGVSKFPRFWKNWFTIHKPTKVSRVPSKGFSAGQGIMISTESMQSNCYDVYDPITNHYCKYRFSTEPCFPLSMVYRIIDISVFKSNFPWKTLGQHRHPIIDRYCESRMVSLDFDFHKAMVFPQGHQWASIWPAHLSWKPKCVYENENRESAWVKRGFSSNFHGITVFKFSEIAAKNSA